MAWKESGPAGITFRRTAVAMAMRALAYLDQGGTTPLLRAYAID
jgi:hypothetical protein